MAGTVQMPRRALDCALALLGVTADCRYDLALALSEACANAIEHAGLGPEYCVTATADGHRCVVEITDHGIGIAEPGHLLHAVGTASVRGRGMAIIRACTDSLDLGAGEPDGLSLRFSKRLEWEPGARELLRAAAA